jgi:hypothetical protein
MLHDLVSNLGRDEVLWIFILTLGAAVWLVAFCAKQWRRVRQSEIEAALKHALIERGMSVEDIERVIKASATSASGCGRFSGLRKSSELKA